MFLISSYIMVVLFMDGCISQHQKPKSSLGTEPAQEQENSYWINFNEPDVRNCMISYSLDNDWHFIFQHVMNSHQAPNIFLYFFTSFFVASWRSWKFRTPCIFFRDRNTWKQFQLLCNAIWPRTSWNAHWSRFKFDSCTAAEVYYLWNIPRMGLCHRGYKGTSHQMQWLLCFTTFLIIHSLRWQYYSKNGTVV